MKNNNKNFKDLSVLVTGADGGVGRAVCNMLSNVGFTVIGIDRKFNDGIPDTVHKIICDLTDAESVSSAFDEVSKLTKNLHAVIHTAGIYDLDSLLEIDEERFLRIFNVNLFGVYRVNKTFLPLMSKGSRIIITSSELAPLDPLPFTGIYAVTKSALEKYAYSLRMETNLLGIFVSVIRPGAIKTTLLGDSTAALDRFCKETTLYPCNAKRFKDIVNRVEARNIKPERIAKLTLKILSAKRPPYLRSVNRNPLLRLLSILPKRLQNFVIKTILKP